jgi:uncharacterized integral membrane protein
VNQPIQPQEQIQQVGPYQVQAQWVEVIVPVLVGIMLLVFIAGMVRNLFKGEEVKLPL